VGFIDDLKLLDNALSVETRNPAVIDWTSQQESPEKQVAPDYSQHPLFHCSGEMAVCIRLATDRSFLNAA